MTDLIISVVKNRRWQDIDCYALSLVKSGYTGKKVMYVLEVPDDAQKNLKELGFEVIPFEQYQNGMHFQTFRFLPATDYLRQHCGEFRFVMWTDVCDLVFQTDPTVWMENNSNGALLLGAKEGRLIKNEGINDIWIQKINISKDEYLKLREEEVLCSGTIQGNSETMLILFEKMCQSAVGISDMQGIDQGLYNYIARLSPFREVTRIPEMSEGFISTSGMFLAANNDPSVWTVEHPYFDRETGLVMTNDRSRPFAIMHGYNRNYGLYDPVGDWRGIVERRYR